MLFLQFFVVYWDLGNMNLEKKFKIFFIFFWEMVSLKRCQNSIGQNSSIMMHFQEWKKGLLTQFTVVTLCTKGFLKFHQHKMTIENNFITIDKIDTCPAFHLIYVSTTEPSNVNQHPLPVTVSLWSLSYPMH